MKTAQKIIKGDVTFDSNINYSNVEEIKGSLDCHETDKACFPKLTTIGGYLDCHETDKDSFPKLTTIGGSLDCRETDKACFPKLKEKDIGNVKALLKVGLAFKRKGFFLCDGILSLIVSTRENANGSKVHKVKIVGKTKVSYCVEVDGDFSHGDTIRQARESLIYKIGDRDKSAYERWTLETKVTKRKAIESYRVITGACESGARHFVESVGKTKSKYTVGEIVELTKGQYGNESYKAFFSQR